LGPVQAMGCRVLNPRWSVLNGLNKSKKWYRICWSE
jgi:hypothetical protein